MAKVLWIYKPRASGSTTNSSQYLQCNDYLANISRVLADPSMSYYMFFISFLKQTKFCLAGHSPVLAVILMLLTFYSYEDQIPLKDLRFPSLEEVDLPEIFQRCSTRHFLQFYYFNFQTLITTFTVEPQQTRDQGDGKLCQQ